MKSGKSKKKKGSKKKKYLKLKTESSVLKQFKNNQ